jgi:hypothetical protein
MSSDSAPAHAPEKLSVVQTLLALAAITVGIVGYLALYAAVGLHEAYIGFLFLFFWAAIQKFDLSVLPATVVGSFTGLALGYALQLLSTRFGAQGALIFGGVALVVLFLLLRQQLKLFINDATMLMLTVAAITHLQAHADFRDLFLSLGLAVVLFGGGVWLLNLVRSRTAKRDAVGAPGGSSLAH